MQKQLGGFAVALSLALLGASPAAQQGTLRTLADEPGKWHPWSFGGGDLSAGELRRLRATPDNVAALKARLGEVASVLRAASIWNSPMGVDAHLSGGVSAPIVPAAQQYQPLAGYILMGSFEHFEIAQGSEPYEHAVAGETPLMQIVFNRVPTFRGGTLLKDELGEFAAEPSRAADILGFPAYGDLLVIATNGRPLWAPVSRERFLKAFVAERRGEAAIAEASIVDQQKKLDEFRKSEASAARQAKYAAAVAQVAAKRGVQAAEHERRYWERDEADTLRNLTKGASRDPAVSRQAATIAGLKAAEDQLAALSDATRQQQACFVDSRDDPSKSGLVPMGTPGCAPLIAQNLEYFVPTLSRGAVQLITLTQFRKTEQVWRLGKPANGASSGSLDLWTTWEAFRTADWKKIVGVIGK